MTKPAKSKWSTLGIAGAIVVAFVACECLAGYFFLGSGALSGKAAGHGALSAEELAALRDVDLGKFSLTASDPGSNGSLLIEFHLIGSVAGSDAGDDGQPIVDPDRIAGQENKSNELAKKSNSAFEELFQREKNRIRDQVIVIVGNAQISPLSPPDFATIKSQILARANSLLGKPLLQEIRFRDFAVVEE